MDLKEELKIAEDAYNRLVYDYSKPATLKVKAAAYNKCHGLRRKLYDKH